ncbi:hypothetical protein GGI35DRAFT_389722 [Trichoderma velutinum]
MLSHRLSFLNILLCPVVDFGLEFTFIKCHSIPAIFYYCPTPLHVSIVGAASEFSITPVGLMREKHRGRHHRGMVLVVGISKGPCLSSISTEDRTPIIADNRHLNYFAGVLIVSWQHDDH